MGYKLMLTLIKNKKKSKATLYKYANVYFAAGQLTEEEYLEVIELINQMED